MLLELLYWIGCVFPRVSLLPPQTNILSGYVRPIRPSIHTLP
jgi:hypothetical protein